MNDISQSDVRIEIKYIVNSENLNIFINLINNLGFMKTFPFRYINSLYYDTPELFSVTENLDGISSRNKYRIRWYYNDEKIKFGWQFEKKIKNGDLGYKKIFKLKNNFYKQNDFSIKNLILNHKKIFSLVNLNIEPKLICNYHRNYYENESGIRLTIDSKLKFTKFSDKFPIDGLKKWQYANFYIIELKFKPEKRLLVSKIIKNFPINSSRCSKYLLGHSKVNSIKYI